MPNEFTIRASDAEVIIDDLSLPHHWQPHVWEHVGKTIDERETFVNEAHERLKRARLYDGDRYDDDVEAAMRLWTKPEVQVVVRALQSQGDQHYRYRAGADRTWAVITRQLSGSDDIEFRLVKADALPAEIAGELPQGFGPVPCKPYSEVVVDKKAAKGDSSNDIRIFDDTPPRRPNVGRDAFTQWPVVLFGSYELYLRHLEGSRPKPKGIMTFCFTEGGGYVGTQEKINDGETRYELIPSDGSHIRRWLAQEIEEFRS